MLAGLALLVAAPAAHAQLSPPPDVPWPQLLPPAASPTHVQPGPVPGCRRARIRCVDRVIRRMTRLRKRLGCDHRAVFANTYLLLTKKIRRTLKRRPRYYEGRRWLIYLDVVFADYYFANFKRGAQLPEAWRIAFDAARRGDFYGPQDMLLGINAHVQRDMPYVMASVGLRFPDGRSRKPDHDRGNAILAAGYEKIVRSAERRYDPFFAVSNPSASPLDDIGGLELVKGWREQVWRNAERLLAARTPAELQAVEMSIEHNAAAWARSIAATRAPRGYRQRRDAYCRARLRR